MLDIDKLPPSLQWLIGAGVLLGGTILGIFGTRSSHKPPIEDDELIRLRAQVVEEKIRRDLDETLSAKVYTRIQKLDERIRDLEQENAVLQNQVNDLKPLRRR